MSQPAFPDIRLDEYYFTRVKLRKRFIFDSTYSEDKFEYLKDKFKKENSKDKTNDFSVLFEIPG